MHAILPTHAKGRPDTLGHPGSQEGTGNARCHQGGAFLLAFSYGFAGGVDGRQGIASDPMREAKENIMAGSMIAQVVRSRSVALPDGAGAFSGNSKWIKSNCVFFTMKTSTFKRSASLSKTHHP
ncbi:hypothetical protein [Sphingomonas sp. KC8]|uniref:hypothetical protein n=1 Tax=Sphingomonas sp. KC8 TaxID=1030157 RepID=UPI001110B3CA|nr:hypothetical protein [Sphingomonas sp. KC8]